MLYRCHDPDVRDGGGQSNQAATEIQTPKQGSVRGWTPASSTDHRPVSKRGVDAAELAPIDQWRRLQAARPTLKQLLLARQPPADIPVPPRGQSHRRWPVAPG